MQCLSLLIASAALLVTEAGFVGISRANHGSKVTLSAHVDFGTLGNAIADRLRRRSSDAPSTRECGGWSAARASIAETEQRGPQAPSEPRVSEPSSQSAASTEASRPIAAVTEKAGGSIGVGDAGDDDGDDDDDDLKKDKDGETGLSAPPEGYEVVCKDGVCELQPVDVAVPATAAVGADASAGTDADPPRGERADAAETAPAAAVAASAGAAAAKPAEAADDSKPARAECADKPVAAAAVAPADAIAVAAEQPAAEAPPVVASLEAMKELIKMGWDDREAAAALAAADGDVVAAAEALAAAEEADLARFETELTAMQARGWSQEAALSALRQTEGDVEAAAALLEEEDKQVNEQFEASVAEMAENGWDEEVARQALFLQWQKDIEKRGGGRKDQQQLEKTADKVKRRNGGNKGGGGGKGGAKGGGGADKGPKLVPRESVVFEVTEDTLQKLVMESPVPVLIDLYADWCGPCKQLGPMLEQAAMRSGGLFRLAKVNADAQRGIAETLKAEALPSVFAVRDGAVIDNFVGVLPPEQMQAFLVRLVMGTARDEAAGLAERQLPTIELKRLSRKLAHVAGLAALGSAKREKLSRKVDALLADAVPAARAAMAPAATAAGEAGTAAAAVDADAAMDAEAAAVAAAKAGVRLVASCLGNCYANIADAKFRRISMASGAYQRKLVPLPPAVAVLNTAGFREKEGHEGYLTLLHRNAAVLAVVQERCEKWLRATADVPRASGAARLVAAAEAAAAEEAAAAAAEEGRRLTAEAEATAAAAALRATAKLAVALPGGRIVMLELPVTATLVEAFAALRREDAGLGDAAIVLTSSFPARRRFVEGCEYCPKSLGELGLAPTARLAVGEEQASAAAAAAKAGGDGAGDVEARGSEVTRAAKAARREELRARMLAQGRGGRPKAKKSGSLFGADDGIVKAQKGKRVEYFGGGSTVTLAAEDSEEGEDGGEAGDETGEAAVAGAAAAGGEEGAAPPTDETASLEEGNVSGEAKEDDVGAAAEAVSEDVASDAAARSASDEAEESGEEYSYYDASGSEEESAEVSEEE